MATTRAVLRTAATALALVLVPGPAMGQSLLDPVIPAGHLRLSAAGDFTSWSQGYGSAFPGGEPLNDATLVPSLGLLESSLRQLTGPTPALNLTLGAQGAFVSRSTVRVPMGLEVGVFDWLTVGASLPLVQTRIEAELSPGAEGGGLGTNPALSSPGAVNGFLSTLAQRNADVAAVVQDRCAAGPDAPGCQDAVATGEALTAAQNTLRLAYGASPFFPAAGTAGAEALAGWASELDAALSALGVPALGSAPPVAGALLDLEGYRELTGIGGALAGTPLNPLESVWAPGDLALSASVRLVDLGARRDSSGIPGLRISAAATGTLRLPTGGPDSLDVFTEAGLSDGQRDLEMGGWFGLSTRRLAVRAQARFTIQESGTFETRANPAAQALGASPATVEVDPGDRLHIAVEPALRLAPALSLGGIWRYQRRGAGTTRVASVFVGGGGETVEVPLEVDFLPALGSLSLPTWSAHEVGATLTYHTVDIGERDGRGFEAFLRIMRTVGGDQGVAPRPVRATMGLRLVRQLWGS